jgi:hypothetical protein
MNSIVVLLFDKITLSAGIPLHIKSLGCTVTGSTGSLTLTSKTVGGTKTVQPQPALVTEQGCCASAKGIAQTARST